MQLAFDQHDPLLLFQIRGESTRSPALDPFARELCRKLGLPLD
jgi:hypothetical protein